MLCQHPPSQTVVLLSSWLSQRPRLTAVSSSCRFSVVSLQDNTGMIEWVYHTETFRSCVTHSYNAHGLHPEKQHGSFQDLYNKHPKVVAG